MSSNSVADLLARLPEGWSEVLYRGRRWGVTRTRHVGGRVEKVYAEELGGADVVSANLYVVDGGHGEGDEQLRPCEMPAATVLDFLRGWEPLPGRGVTPVGESRRSSLDAIAGDGADLKPAR